MEFRLALKIVTLQPQLPKCWDSVQVHSTQPGYSALGACSPLASFGFQWLLASLSSQHLALAFAFVVTLLYPLHVPAPSASLSQERSGEAGIGSKAHPS